MNNKLLRIRGIAVFLAGISAASIPATASAEWSIREINVVSPYHVGDVRPLDINNLGQITGYYDDAHGQHAFIASTDGAIGDTNLGTLGGTTSVAFGINDSGQVVGSSTEFSHAFISGPNGAGTTDLGTLGDGFYSGGYGINNSGQAVGYSYTGGSSSSHHAFITGPNGEGITDLGTLAGGSGRSFATGINDSGQVVGYSDTDTSGFHAFITGPNGEGMTDLGTLGGGASLAHGINDSGQVVGESSIAGDSVRHAFITGPNGEGMIDLGTFGGTRSIAVDINNSGQAVGDASGANSFLYSDGEMIDLSKLDEVVAAGWTDIMQVYAINDLGQITGIGRLHNGNAQAFVLSPFFTDPYQTIHILGAVPEPETYAMLLAGLGLLGFMARRRKESST